MKFKFKGLPKPIRKQREVLYLPDKGNSVVLGTAGSGKTLMALYRAAYLSAPNMPHSGRTLLLTFNRTLATYLKHLKPPELSNVEITNYHKFARGYLASRNKMSPYAICDRKEEFVQQAIKHVAKHSGKTDLLDMPMDFLLEKISWIQSHGIKNEQEYRNIKRKVKSEEEDPFADSVDVLLEILRAYRAIRAKHGYCYDWDDIASYVGAEFLRDHSPRLFRHIIIDEGQDFSLEMIRSLTLAIPEDGSLTFFGDVAQQIYELNTSWRLGLEFDEKHLWRFNENYRNTSQIARLGLEIAHMPYFKGLADIIEPKLPRADGPLPTLVKCKSHDQQLETAVELAAEESSTRSVAILFKNREQERQLFKVGLPRHARRLDKNMAAWADGPALYYGTYHSAKGLEFDVVILPFLEAGNLPDPGYVDAYGEEAAATYYGRLLYVAVTRAKTDVIILYTRELTPLLPEKASLYAEVSPP